MSTAAEIREQFDGLHCWRFAVTTDDAIRRGQCTYYGPSLPDGGINWIGPRVRESGAVYCDRHWTQVQAERAGR
jgi:hypothetical protein